MAAAPAEKRLWTDAEYLAMDRASLETKHQLVDGEVFAMSGGTFDHAAIAAQLQGQLTRALERLPCVAVTADLRIKAEGASLYSYPDASIICGPPRFEDDRFDTVLNPSVVFEVLSPTTEAFDRGDKFDRYARIATLSHYVLVQSSAVRVEIFTRNAGTPESWTLRRYGAGESFSLDLAAGGPIELAVDPLYASALHVART